MPHTLIQNPRLRFQTKDFFFFCEEPRIIFFLEDAKIPSFCRSKLMSSSAKISKILVFVDKRRCPLLRRRRKSIGRSRQNSFSSLKKFSVDLKNARIFPNSANSTLKIFCVCTSLFFNEKMNHKFNQPKNEGRKNSEEVFFMRIARRTLVCVCACMPFICHESKHREKKCRYE